MQPNAAKQTSLLLIAAALIQPIRDTLRHIRTPRRLHQGFLYAKGVFIMQLITVWLGFSAPFFLLFYSSLTGWDIFIGLIGLPMAIGLMITPELNIAPSAKLVITKPLLSATATVHLKSPYQGIDIQTYRELFRLVECLPQYGINTLSLSSPMFYDATGQLRCFSVLEKGLNKRGARLSHSPAGAFDCLLGKISLRLARPRPKHALTHPVTLLKWHKIRIALSFTAKNHATRESAS
jgi:hypothetical protein